MQHDAQWDYYGRRLATCSSDGTTRIFDVDAVGERKMEAELRGHDGPVWQVQKTAETELVLFCFVSFLLLEGGR